MLAAIAGMGGSGGFTRLPGFLEGIARAYGPVASWRMPRARFWFLDDPALIETMLTASGYDAIKSRGLRRMRRLLGQGLLTSDEPLHLRQRRLVQPAFHRERVAGYAATMIELARAAAERLRDGEIVAVDAAMNRLALRIAAATLFSADVDDDADAIGAAVTGAMAAFPASLGPFAELLDHVPFHPATRRFGAARTGLDAVIYRLIEERRRDGADRGDLLSMLLSSRDETGAPMPTELVRDEALTLLLAGHETTANALTWTWDALARNRAAEARLHAELDDGPRRPRPGPGRRLPAPVHARRGRRVDAAAPAGVDPGPPRDPADAPGRLGRPRRLRAAGGADRHPPQPALLEGARGVPARALVQRRDGGAPEVRLLPVRRRQPDLHRRELRLDRSRPRRWPPWRAASASTASIPRRSRSTRWSPCAPAGRS